MIAHRVSVSESNADDSHSGPDRWVQLITYRCSCGWNVTTALVEKHVADDMLHRHLSSPPRVM